MLSRSQIDELAEEGVFLRNIYEITQAIEAAIAASQPSPTAKEAKSVPAVDERDDFEQVFPLPSGCIRVGTGYASTGYSNWAAHTHCERWQGWQARAARAPAESVGRDAERLDWLLWKLPGDALRHVVGEIADTSDGQEFRAAIDAAMASNGGNK